MRILFTLAIILSLVTTGYSDPKKPKPKKCTTYSCSDWDWKNGKGLFDPHIQVRYIRTESMVETMISK